MAYFLLEALLVVISAQAVTVASLRCPCLVQGEHCGSTGQHCWKTSWVGDRDSYYDSLVPLFVKQSVAEDGNADEKRMQELRDRLVSSMAYRRETLWGWPACRHGFCDISHNNSVFEIMQILQFDSRDPAPAGGYVLACINATLFPTPFYNRFVGCGIVPEDPSKRELNDECRVAGGMLSFGRGSQNGLGSHTFCIYNFTTAPASDAAATSLAGLPVLAPIVPVLHQASALVCPCQINATIAFGDRRYIRVVSTPSDDLASLMKALQSSAAKARVCNLASASYSDCNFERSYPEELVISFWPGCYNGRCEIQMPF